MNRITQLMSFVLGGALAFTVLQGVSGCVDGRGVVFGTLDQAGRQELQRFDAAYEPIPTIRATRDNAIISATFTDFSAPITWSRSTTPS